MGMRPRKSGEEGQEEEEEEEEELPGCGTTGSGQSGSTSKSAGLATPAGDSTCLKLDHLDIQGDDAGSQGPVGSKKKKRGQRAVGPDKSGRGLRQFSMKVCEKVESKGRTTYNEVADELVAEFADPGNSGLSPDQQQYDEKNIRRRVYDALNVLMAMDIISKDKRKYNGRVFLVLSERLVLRSKIEKKTAYLHELEEQLRNPPSGVSLPFILVQTRPHATVEVEISEDMQLVHFDFNSTPFELHDDNYVLKAMKFCGRPQSDNTTHNLADGGEGSSMSGLNQSQVPPSVTNLPARPPTSPPLPGILKARVKNEP
ncbi:Transcription factor-like protein DPB [Arachis hypogaea]|nr:Transcription factor-like protein DPB [Arachis hypogaea]